MEDGRMEVDLEHHLLPDPIADMLAAMQAKINELEQRLEYHEKGANPDADIQYSQRAKRRTKNIETA